jgi:hypothetical protein
MLIVEDKDEPISLSPGDCSTLPQLCQNYLLLCVLNGKSSERAAASDAWIHSVDDQ